MEKDRDAGKKPHLRLVVNNAEKRSQRAPAQEEEYVPLEELARQKEELRAPFYQELGTLQEKVYLQLERYFEAKGWQYGFDPHHGRLLVVAAEAVAPELQHHGGAPQDEALVFVNEDADGRGACLSLEMILPYYSEDPAVMEETLLYSVPILPYGSFFLEENRQDGYLDLIYRLAFPLYPPAPTSKILERFFRTAAEELQETLRALSEYPEEQ